MHVLIKEILNGKRPNLQEFVQGFGGTLNLLSKLEETVQPPLLISF